MSLVVVTGASGFLGSVIIDQLLEAGYKVRGTARSSKVSRVQAAYASFGSQFEVTAVEDLATSDLMDAFRNADALIHVGSPLSSGGEAAFILKTAISGTERVLEHAAAAGVKKIVVTASIVSLIHPKLVFTNVTVDENDWNTQTYEDALKPDATPFEVYSVAKKTAEEAVWKFAKSHPEIDVATVHPPYLYGIPGRGQAIDAPASGTNNHIYKLISGPKGRPLPPPLNPSFTNVADAARAHVTALKAPPSDKLKRIIPVGGRFTWKQAAEYLAKARPELRERLPIFDGPEQVTASASFDSSSAARLVGWNKYIGWQETLETTIDHLLKREKDLGVVV